MMKKTDTKITRYEHGNFYVDIVETEYGIEAWLTYMNYGVSDMMFGLIREQHDHTYTDEEMLAIVDANLIDYEIMYMKDRREEEERWESEAE